MLVSTRPRTGRAGGCGEIVSTAVAGLHECIRLVATLTARLTLVTVWCISLRLMLPVVCRSRSRDLEVSEIGNIPISPLHETGHAICGRHFVAAMIVGEKLV